MLRNCVCNYIRTVCTFEVFVVIVGLYMHIQELNFHVHNNNYEYNVYKK